MPNTPPNLQQESRELHTNTRKLGSSVLLEGGFNKPMVSLEKIVFFPPKNQLTACLQTHCNVFTHVQMFVAGSWGAWW